MASSASCYESALASLVADGACLKRESFGSRAAVHLLCREDMASDLPAELAGVVAFAYPLTHATQHRERKLAELPPSARVLFISGTRTIATPSRLVALPVSR